MQHQKVVCSIFNFMEGTPNGFEDTAPNACPSGSELQGRRFLGIGWGPIHVSSGAEFNETLAGCPCGGWIGYQEYTVFWVGTGDTRDAHKCAKCVN
jgi:hypothetical protein